MIGLCCGSEILRNVKEEERGSFEETFE